MKFSTDPAGLTPDRTPRRRERPEKQIMRVIGGPLGYAPRFAQVALAYDASNEV